MSYGVAKNRPQLSNVILNRPKNPHRFLIGPILDGILLRMTYCSDQKLCFPDCPFDLFFDLAAAGFFHLSNLDLRDINDR